eukprot:COSAG01_NODE_27765_length_677_cov_1.453287_1_plen_93_part_00
MMIDQDTGPTGIFCCLLRRFSRALQSTNLCFGAAPAPGCCGGRRFLRRTAKPPHRIPVGVLCARRVSMILTHRRALITWCVRSGHERRRESM